MMIPFPDAYIPVVTKTRVEVVLPTYLAFNSSPPGHKGRHFADEIFKSIFMNERFCISIQMSLNFVPKGQIDNKSALAQVMAWYLKGNKPLAKLMPIQFTDATKER